MGDEKHVHQRKRTSVKSRSPDSPRTTTQKKAIESRKSKVKQEGFFGEYTWYISSAIGLFLMVILAYEFSKTCNNLHEAQMWFTNIKEVEREISFRTESGLYYSYYKQLVNAPSLGQGMHALIYDNLTEHTVTMNVLERMNIYQEVILGILYRSIPFIKKYLEPVYFYIYSIYGLHGGLFSCVFLISWVLSGTWVAGILAAAFYVFNRDHTTRVEYIIPLRENFSLPFLWSQIFCITVLFRAKATKLQETISTVGILLSTFLLSLFWQFNQFVLLLQAMALFGVQVLHLVPHRKVRTVYLCQLAGLFGVFLLQFFNTMIVGGLAVSFILAALVTMAIQGEKPSGHGIVLRIFKVLIYIGLVFTLMMSFLKLVKLVIHVEADEHIYKFVLHKFGILYSRDFDVQLYVCNGAFEFMSVKVIKGLTQNLVFPFYAVCQAIGIISILAGTVYRWRHESTYKKSEDNETDSEPPVFCLSRPELAYNIIQPVFFGGVAISTVRMKYLWTPHMCILASLCVSDYGSYKWILGKLEVSSRIVLEILRHGILIVLLSALVSMCLPALKKEMNDLREFYDPDTVELMEWIKDKTPENTAFSGSMQLLAGVKLSTNHPITNHPHYEDKELRKRTRELYTMYSKTPPDAVHATLKKFNASYIILEDSICLALDNECGLPVQLDVDMGIMPDRAGAVEDKSGLVASDVPRFCDKIRHMKPPYSDFFKVVFKNKTFRVYKVL